MQTERRSIRWPRVSSRFHNRLTKPHAFDMRPVTGYRRTRVAGRFPINVVSVNLPYLNETNESIRSDDGPTIPKRGARNRLDVFPDYGSVGGCKRISQQRLLSNPAGSTWQQTNGCMLGYPPRQPAKCRCRQRREGIGPSRCGWPPVDHAGRCVSCDHLFQCDYWRFTVVAEVRLPRSGHMFEDGFVKRELYREQVRERTRTPVLQTMG